MNKEQNVDDGRKGSTPAPESVQPDRFLPLRSETINRFLGTPQKCLIYLRFVRTSSLSIIIIYLMAALTKQLELLQKENARLNDLLTLQGSTLRRITDEKTVLERKYHLLVPEKPEEQKIKTRVSYPSIVQPLRLNEGGNKERMFLKKQLRRRNTETSLGMELANTSDEDRQEETNPELQPFKKWRKAIAFEDNNHDCAFKNHGNRLFARRKSYFDKLLDSKA